MTLPDPLVRWADARRVRVFNDRAVRPAAR